MFMSVLEAIHQQRRSLCSVRKVTGGFSGFIAGGQMAPNDVRRIQLTEQRVAGRRLGRHIHHDPRSRDYQAHRATQIVSVTHQATGLPFDQGHIGSCTANALCGALDSAPDFTGGTPLDEKDAVRIYELETKLEGQPYPPNDPGGSGLMVCKAARQLGMISSYQHAFGIQDALEALVLRARHHGRQLVLELRRPGQVNRPGRDRC